MSARLRTRLAWAGLALLAAAAGWDGSALWRDRGLNRQIAAGTLPAEAADERPEMRFARAAALAASGAEEAALNRYGLLHDDPELGRAARYNGANLLMRQGMALQEARQRGQALALIELAKESYREILRRDAGDWPARYNLDRAQRLVPDPEDQEDEPADARERAERAMTTMRGYAPGLP
jgi:mxaK protein